MKNDYYDIAYNDLKYLQATLHLPFYNNIAVNAQQIAEKMLKSVAERVCVDVEKLLTTHNLRALYTEINKVDTNFSLNKGDLSMLKDIYFDAQCPGDNFVTVDKKTCDECLSIMYDTIDEVNSARRHLGLDYHEFKRLFTADDVLKDMDSF